MATSFGNIQLAVQNLLSDNDLAEIAEVSYSVWQNRIHYGITGFSMRKNRGSLPFVEYQLDTDGFVQSADNGGSENLTLTLRFNVGGNFINIDRLALQNQAQSLIRTSLVLAKNKHLFADAGNTQIGTIVNMPWGAYQEVQFDIGVSYDIDSFGQHEGQ